MSAGLGRCPSCPWSGFSWDAYLDHRLNRIGDDIHEPVDGR